MSVARAFALSSITVAAAAFGSLAMAAELPVWMLSLGWGAFGLCLVQSAMDPARAHRLFTLRFSPVTWNILLVLAFLGFWIDVFWISQELLPAGIHFLIVLMINKLFNLHQRRDFLHLYAVSFMAVLASAAMTVKIWYAPFLLLYFVAGVWTLWLHHLTKEGEASAPSTGAEAPVITRRFFWSTNALAAAALCLAASIFFLLPRVGIGFLQKGRSDSLRTSGFSDKVDLGVMGLVKQDPSIVMRVQLPDGKPDGAAPLYLRGMAYDRYNGRSWENSLLHRRSLVERPQGLFTIRANGPPALGHATRGFRQDILLEALDTDVLFGAPQPISLSGDFVTVQGDLMGVLYLPSTSSSRVQYSVRSQRVHVEPTDAKAVAPAYPESVRRQYLQLPALVREIRELSHAVTHTRETSYDAVLLVKQHLLENYRYSLDIETGRSAHPLEDFLLIRKTGYCEHYATAMVVMLRSIGIPARLVTGFLATEWNGFGQYYTVRQRDAHAWVEVYFPKSGWVTFDPTPPVSAGDDPNWWGSLGGAIDSLRLRWDRLIIQYDAADQLSMIQGVRDGGDAVWSKTAGAMTVWLSLAAKSVKTITKEWLILVIIMWIFLACVLARRISAHRSTPSRWAGGDAIAVQWYEHMLRLAAASGFHKPAGQTPLEFARHVEQRWREASPYVNQLTRLYYRVRFGHTAASRADVRAAEELLRELTALKRRHR
jgi:transglutaminase-like putative cysteine protease